MAAAAHRPPARLAMAPLALPGGVMTGVTTPPVGVGPVLLFPVGYTGVPVPIGEVVPTDGVAVVHPGTGNVPLGE